MSWCYLFTQALSLALEADIHSILANSLADSDGFIESNHDGVSSTHITVSEVRFSTKFDQIF